MALSTKFEKNIFTNFQIKSKENSFNMVESLQNLPSNVANDNSIIFNNDQEHKLF